MDLRAAPAARVPDLSSSSPWRALLRRPRYASFTLTVSLSRITGAMFMTSGVLLVLSRTHSASLAGVTAAAASFPIALSGPGLGAWLDVARRPRVLIVSDQLLSASGLVGILLVTGHAADWTVPLLAVLYSVTGPLSTGSFAAALSAVAGDTLLDRASTIEATSLNLGVVLGPALAGVLCATAGPAAAIEIQGAVTLVVAALIAVNPAFDARPEIQAASIAVALRDGFAALRRNRLLRDSSLASMLASTGWGGMLIAFPLYAAERLHAGTHASGYLWAGLAGGSILGTFLFAGQPSMRRVSVSYAALAISSLAWAQADSLVAGIALVTFTGVLEGPAYSGTIALRQRHAPPQLRGQVLNTLSSLNRGAGAIGSLLGGLVDRPVPSFLGFCAVMLIASAIAARGATASPAEPASAPAAS